MNNCRAGLYSFASTTTWLHRTGVASPPSLVVLGLTLPDSRILTGIAGIGLTLVNIVIILPHLRRPILDDIHAHAAALACEQTTMEDALFSPSGSHSARTVECLAPTSVSSREHFSLPLSCSTTVKSACVVAEPLDVNSEAASHHTLSLPEGDDNQRPVLGTVHTCKNALAHEQSAEEQLEASPVGTNTTFPIDLRVKNPVPASVALHDREYQSPSLVRSATTEDIDSRITTHPSTLLPEESTNEHLELSSAESNTARTVDLNVCSPVPAPMPARDREHPSPSLTHGTTIEDINSGIVSHTTLLITEEHVGASRIATHPVDLNAEGPALARSATARDIDSRATGEPDNDQQGVLGGVHSREGALAHVQCAEEHVGIPPTSIYPVDLNVESGAIPSVSCHGGEHQSPVLRVTRITTIEDIDSGAASHTTPLSAGEPHDGQQGVLDSTHICEGTPVHGRYTDEHGMIPPNTNDPIVKNPVLQAASASIRDKELCCSPLTCCTTVNFICRTITESSEHSQVPQSAEKTDEDETPLKIYRSPEVKSSEVRASSSNLFTREGRSALHIALPVPDADEIAFFGTDETSFSSSDLRGQFSAATCGQRDAPKYSTIEDGPAIGEQSEQGGQLDTSSNPRVSGLAETGEDPTDMTMLHVNENAVTTSRSIGIDDQRNSVAEITMSHPPDGLAVRVDTTSSAQAGLSLAGDTESLAKQRPESLEFIPQSVVRRYPFVPLVSARPCVGHQASSSELEHQFTPSHVFIQNPAMLLRGPRPRASYTTLQGHWRTSFLTDVHPRVESMRGVTLIVEAQNQESPLEDGSASLSEYSRHDLTPTRQRLTHVRRLGVLARAALRDRRFSAHRNNDDGIDDSSSGSESESDSDSQYSSGSSADENMLPHMLGADLIAALNSNSESELNLDNSMKTNPASLDPYGDFLISEGSATDVSMIMRVSSIDDASDNEVMAPVASRALTYEDIEQWATGVVQKCVKGCRSRAPTEPPSPSQASDVCAERPSGSGISQCPLSGLHCKLGAAGSASHVPVPKAQEPTGSLPATRILPGRQPLSIRNVRDIPEFVPRQRPLVRMGRVEVSGARRVRTRSTIDVTRDAATAVIARMESQARFGAQKRVAGGMNQERVVATGSWQGAPRNV